MRIILPRLAQLSIFEPDVIVGSIRSRNIRRLGLIERVPADLLLLSQTVLVDEIYTGDIPVRFSLQ